MLFIKTCAVLFLLSLFFKLLPSFILCSSLYILDLLTSLSPNTIEFVYSFIIFSCYSNKKRKYPGFSDEEIEDIEEALNYTDLSFWDDDEKDLEFFLKRDRAINGDYDGDYSEFKNIPPELLLEIKNTQDKIREEENKKTLEMIKKAPKDSFINSILKDNWEELIKEGKSPFRDENNFKPNNSKTNKKSSNKKSSNKKSNKKK